MRLSHHVFVEFVEGGRSILYKDYFVFTYLELVDQGVFKNFSMYRSILSHQHPEVQLFGHARLVPQLVCDGHMIHMRKNVAAFAVL